MKKYVGALALFISFIVLSCEKEKRHGLLAASINVPFQLAASEKALVSSSEVQVSIEAKYINDERCSSCPTPGSAYVRIIVSNLNDALTETTLTIGDCNGQPRLVDKVSVNLKGAVYHITLQSVSKVSDKNIAILLVEKGN